jgi:hypothetical protein
MQLEARHRVERRLDTGCHCGSPTATLRKRNMAASVAVWLQCDGCGKGYGEAMKRADHWYWQDYPLWDDGAAERYSAQRQAAYQETAARQPARPIISGRQIDNLNDAEIKNADGPTVHIAAERRPVLGATAGIDVHFQGLEGVVAAEIRRWPVVVGCMAWLTNEAILTALGERRAAQIIVQKEDFLRPDAGAWSADRQRSLYEKIPGVGKSDGGLWYNYCGEDYVEGVRCLGICLDRSATPPRMHHKFLVFCSTFDPPEENPDSTDLHDSRSIRAECAWTGSFNATKNGTRSLENGVLIRNPRVAEAYYQEWKTLLGLTEPLDWQSTYLNPEYRLGT